MQHLAINIHMNTHGAICICLSVNHPRAGNMCLPKLREWAGVKAMTTLSDVNLHQEKTHFSLFKKQHTKCNLIDTFLQKKCLSSWGRAGTEAQTCCRVPQLPGLCPGTLYLMHKTCPAQIHWRCLGPTHVPWHAQAYCFQSAAYNHS